MQTILYAKRCQAAELSGGKEGWGGRTAPACCRFTVHLLFLCAFAAWRLCVRDFPLSRLPITLAAFVRPDIFGKGWSNCQQPWTGARPRHTILPARRELRRAADGHEGVANLLGLRVQAGILDAELSHPAGGVLRAGNRLGQSVMLGDDRPLLAECWQYDRVTGRQGAGTGRDRRVADCPAGDAHAVYAGLGQHVEAGAG